MGKKISIATIFIVLALLFASCAKKIQYQIADAQIPLSLPRDFYAHSDFQTEWWYYTGQVQTDDGKKFGFELVFFKRRTDNDIFMGFPIRYYSNPAHMAHFAITDISTGKFLYSERRERDQKTCRSGKAGASEEILWVWNRDWYVKELNEKYHMYAKMPSYELSLVLTPAKPAILHGQNGFFQKDDGAHATYYVAFTRLEARGTLVVDNKPYKVSGLAWHDHEFGTHQLSKEQAGWDWFSIQLDDDQEVMLYLLRNIDGTYDPFSRAVLVKADCSKEEVLLSEIKFELLSFWESNKSEAKYPVRWKIEIAKWNLSMEVEPYMNDCELVTPKSTMTAYWEGPVKVDGEMGDNRISGNGYLEMCGYDRPLKYLTFVHPDF